MANEYKIIGSDGVEYGPSSLTEIRAWIEDHRVGPQTLVWQSDDRRWRPAGEIPELRWDLPTSPTPPCVARPPHARTSRPAGFWPRLAAWMLDYCVVNAVASILGIPFAPRLRPLLEQAAQLNPAQDADRILTLYFQALPLVLVLALIYSVVSACYYIGFNGRYGGTPGKWLLGIEIRRRNGALLSYADAFRRYGAELLSFMVAGVGYLMIFWHEEKRGLHDVLADTWVVYREFPGDSAE